MTRQSISIKIYVAFAIVFLLDVYTGYSSIPPEWQPYISQLNMFYTYNDSNVPSNGMPMIGNGFLATIIGSKDVWISGVFNGPAVATITPSQRARIPSLLNVLPPGHNAHAALDIARGTYFRRSFLFPLENAKICDKETFIAGLSCNRMNQTIWIEQKWYAHQTLPSVMVLEIEVFFVSASGERLSNHSEFSSSSTTTKDPAAILSLQVDSGEPTKDFTYKTTTIQDDIIAWNGSTIQAETQKTPLVQFALLQSKIPSQLVVPTIPMRTTYHIAVRTSIETAVSTDMSILKAAETNYFQAQQALNSGQFWNEHVHAWIGTDTHHTDGLWEIGANIHGRPDAGGAFNTSLYSLLSSVRIDRPYSLAPGGLTNAYHGHTFWDCETWMFPPILLMRPSLAQSLLHYRCVRLPEAYEKAQSYTGYSYKGAMFPWESAFSGVETCPTSAPTGLREIHISGDIAFAYHQYHIMTNTTEDGDKWLRQESFPVLAGIADFWISKTITDTAIQLQCRWLENADLSLFELDDLDHFLFSDILLQDDLHIAKQYLYETFCQAPTSTSRRWISPWRLQSIPSELLSNRTAVKQYLQLDTDEYVFDVVEYRSTRSKAHCEAHSNHICKMQSFVHERWFTALEQSKLKVLNNKELSLHINDVIPPDEYHDHVDDSVYTNSVARLSLQIAVQAAQDLDLPSANYTHWQSVADRLVILYNSKDQIHPEFLRYQGDTIKQADVILLYYPLQISFGNVSLASHIADLKYYGARTSVNGPAMTWGMQSIGYLDVNQLALAASNFNRSFANVQNPFKVWTETPQGGAPNFLTGAGGYLQVVMMGYAGIRIHDNLLRISPTLIESTSKIELRHLVYRGISFSFGYDDKNMTFHFKSSDQFDASLIILDHSNNSHILNRESVTIQLDIQPVDIVKQNHT